MSPQPTFVVVHINDDYKVEGERMKKCLSIVKDKTSEGFSARFVKVIEESMCKVCGLEEENSGQVLWDIEIAQEVWKISGHHF